MPKKLTKKQREKRAEARADKQLSKAGKAYRKKLNAIHDRSNKASQKIQKRKRRDEEAAERQYERRRKRILNAHYNKSDT